MLRLVVHGIDPRDLAEEAMKIGMRRGIIGDLEEWHENVVQDFVKVLDASLDTVDVTEKDVPVS